VAKREEREKSPSDSKSEELPNKRKTRADRAEILQEKKKDTSKDRKGRFQKPALTKKPQDAFDNIQIFEPKGSAPKEEDPP